MGMAIIRPAHDRDRCGRCLELRAQEAMAPVAAAGPPDWLMAETYHPRPTYDLAPLERPWHAPLRFLDDDRETLWGEP